MINRIKNNEYIFISLILFLILFLIGDRVFAKIGGIAYDLSSLPYAKLYSGRGKADVLILGNSRAYHHLDEELWSKELDLNVKVYAIEAASMEYNEALLIDYIDRYGIPRAIIVEATCLTWDNGQVVNMRGLTARSRSLKKILQRDYFNKYILGEIFNLYRLNSTSYLNTLHKILVNYKQPIFTGVISEREVDVIKNRLYEPYFVNREDNLNSLVRIKKMSDDKGFILNILISPFLHEFIMSQKEYDVWIDKTRSKINNDKLFYDYNDILKSMELFKDDTHLNNRGVIEFHEKLKNTGYFQDLKRELSLLR